MTEPTPEKPKLIAPKLGVEGFAEQSVANQGFQDPQHLQDLQDPQVAEVLQGLKAIQTLTALQNAILKLLASRQPGATTCPSDAARAVYPQPDQWRAAMPAVRAVAAQLVAKGRLEVTQGGQVVDIRSAKGPVRLRLPRS